MVDPDARRRVSFGRLAFAIVMISLPAVAPAAEETEPLTLDRTIAIALASNRDLLAARMERSVAEGGLGTARELPNPELALEGSRETPNYGATLSFPIEIAGKRVRRIRLAEAGAESVDASIARLAAATRSAARRRFYAVVAARSRVENTTALLGLAERTREAARDRFESGSASRLELLQASLAADEAAIEADAAAGRLRAAQADLNTLLSRPPDTPLAVTGTLFDGSVPESDEAIGLAQASSVELAALDRGILEQKARVDLARAERFPDPVVSAGLAYRSPPEFTYGWRAGVSVTLPVFTTHGAAVATEEAALMKLEAEREAAAARVRGDVFAALLEAASRRKQLARYGESVLPEAQEVETMSEEAYRAGQTNIVSMLQSLQAASDIRLRVTEAGLEYQTALADLEEAMGVPLP